MKQTIAELMQLVQTLTDHSSVLVMLDTSLTTATIALTLTNVLPNLAETTWSVPILMEHILAPV